MGAVFVKMSRELNDVVAEGVLATCTLLESRSWMPCGFVVMGGRVQLHEINDLVFLPMYIVRLVCMNS